MLSRRAFLGTAGFTGLALAAPGCTERPGRAANAAFQALDRSSGSPEAVARDEDHWRRVAGNYRVAADYTYLEAGYFGIMAAPVRLHNNGTRKAGQAVVHELLDHHRLFTVRRTGTAAGDGVRVTPAL